MSNSLPGEQFSLSWLMCLLLLFEQINIDKMACTQFGYNPKCKLLLNVTAEENFKT